MNNHKLNKYKTNTISPSKNKVFTPELNHHSPQSRRSRALARVLPTSQRRWNSSSQTKNYSTLFSTAGKAWASAPERLPRKYGWFSSGRRQHAFTIIEVVLVLAIAGLIFLMVFIALPALQRNQRNTQYKNNLSLVISAVQNYRANNRNQNPPETATPTGIMVNSPDGQNNHPFYKYIDSLPDGTWVKIINQSENFQFTNGAANRRGRVIVFLNTTCSGPSGSFLSYVIPYRQGSVSAITVLEEGDGVIYCENVV